MSSVYDYGTPPTEQRGGKRRIDSWKEVRENIVSFIKTLSVRDYHYSRFKICHQYVPPELNIQDLYRQWLSKNKHFVEQLVTTKKIKRTPSISLFKNIFHSQFNLSFGVPASDKCSKCEEYDTHPRKKGAFAASKEIPRCDENS